MQWKTEAAEQRRKGWSSSSNATEKCGFVDAAFRRITRITAMPFLAATQTSLRIINWGMRAAGWNLDDAAEKWLRSGSGSLYVEDAPCSGARLLPPLENSRPIRVKAMPSMARNVIVSFKKMAEDSSVIPGTA